MSMAETIASKKSEMNQEQVAELFDLYESMVQVVTAEGSYDGSRQGPGTHIDVWAWNGFGFTLQWRSLPGAFDPASLGDADARTALLDASVGPDRSLR